MDSLSFTEVVYNYSISQIQLKVTFTGYYLLDIPLHSFEFTVAQHPNIVTQSGNSVDLHINRYIQSVIHFGMVISFTLRF